MWVIPAIDLRGGRCVRLRQGDFTRETVFSDDPVAVARRWAQAGAPRLHLVDLDGARLGQPVHSAVIESIVRAVSIPCQLGGGVRSTEALEQAWSWGIHSVVIGTRAFEDPDWFRCQARRFPERLWLGLDVR
ncbi:MAG: 1-(5-phosphoribosyl)-5-((5-phosphoribosylamino)methylideneamino)imidazole-4-carboxamide isomerase, partial [Gemmataceae bacterium]